MLQFALTTLFVLILGAAAYLLMQPVSQGIATNKEFLQWRKLWLIVTLVGFLSPMYMIFLMILAVMVNGLVPKSAESRITAYFLLLCTLPQLEAYLRGIGGIQNLFTMSYPRMLTFVLLIPLLRTKNNTKFKITKFPSDKYLIGFVVLNSALSFRDNTFTNALRDTFYLVVDILIPYLAISRNLVSRELFEKIFLALLLALSAQAVIGIFESVKWWHVYQSLPYANEILHAHRKYDSRAGVLRANAIFTGPIIFGYAQAIALGLYGYFFTKIANKTRAIGIALVLLVALYCSVSRGAWVGFVVIALVYIWTAKERVKTIAMVGAGLVATLPFIALTPFADKFIDLLPFIGETRADTVTYRQDLLSNATIVIQRNLLFGSTRYLEEPEMMAMRQGEGIVDLVNTYVQIALANGVVGLALFLGIFLGITLKIYFLIGKLPPGEETLRNIGRTILAILCGILTVIATMSSIDYVTTLYWTFAAIGAAYIRLARQVLIEPIENSGQQPAQRHPPVH